MLTTDLSTGTNYFSATLPLWIRQDTSESKRRWHRCLPSTPVAERTHIGWFTSSNLYRVKGYSFFLSAYDSKKETISFLEYDLKPLYDFARRMRN